jgi:hypothetical protein
LDRSPNDVGITAKPGGPKCVTKNDDPVLSFLLFLSVKHAPEHRLGFHHFEKTVTNLYAGNSFSLALRSVTGHEWVPA